MEARLSPREYRKRLLALQRDVRTELAANPASRGMPQMVLLQRCLELLDELEAPLTRFVMKVGMQ